jgi:hypothetical protein
VIVGILAFLLVVSVGVAIWREGTRPYQDAIDHITHRGHDR